MITSHQRWLAARQLLREIERIARQKCVRDMPELHRRFRLLQTHGAFAEPDQRGFLCSPLYDFRPRVPPDSHQLLKLLILFAEDDQLGPIWRYRRVNGGRSCTNYGPLSHIISVDISHPETTVFKASCLLHELGHALEALREHRVGRDNALRQHEDRVREEVGMFEFDFALLERLGGTRYKRALKAGMATIARLLSQRGQPTTSVRLEGSGIALDSLWGRSRHDAVRRNRDGTFSLHCYFRFYEEHDSATALHRKIAMVGSFMSRHPTPAQQTSALLTQQILVGSCY